MRGVARAGEAFVPPALAALLALLTAAAQAEMLSASVSASASTSVGSVSDSVGRSSAASSRTDRQARIEGDYRVADIAPLADRPGCLRLQLLAQRAPWAGTKAAPSVPTDDDARAASLVLNLPQTVVAAAGLRAGDLLQALPRAHGVLWTLGATRRPVFLVLEDAVQRQLPAVALAM